MNNYKRAFVANIIIFILEVFANIWMMTGVSLKGATGTLSAARLAMFKFFTVDSNVLLGIVALLVAVEEYRVMKGKKEELSSKSYILKLVGTVGVTLTMLVTVFFLAPTMGMGVFYNSNLFLHVINPLLSIVTFVFFEKSLKIGFVHTFTGIIPMVIYACYYVTVTLMHAPGGVIAKGYDWYGFFAFGLKSGVIVVPLLVVITYIISLVLWKWNRRKA